MLYFEPMYYNYTILFYFSNKEHTFIANFVLIAAMKWGSALAIKFTGSALKIASYKGRLKERRRKFQRNLLCCNFSIAPITLSFSTKRSEAKKTWKHTTKKLDTKRLFHFPIRQSVRS